MRRNPWPLIVFGILGGTAVLNTIVFISAQDSAVGSTDDNPYQSSLTFNKVIEANANGSALTDELVLRISELKEGRRELTIAMPDSLRGKVQKATLQFMRPSDTTLDETVALKPTGDSLTGALSLKTDGLYVASLVLETPDRNYRFEQEAMISGDSTLRLNPRANNE